MIAIHYQSGNYFSKYWKTYLDNTKTPYKIVNAYASNIIDELKDCNFFLWHINNLDYRDQIFAKYVMNAAESMGVKVFPDFNTNWHFDDKIAQKYLFESTGLPFVKTFVFYEKEEAIKWARKTVFPKVFKLRKGSGSKGVILAKTQKDALNLINTAFGKGFQNISTWFLFKERLRKYKIGKESILGVVKGFIRVFIGTEYITMSSREKGYVYFQEFVPKNDFDIRVVVIGNRAFGIKRLNRKGDFRASGSGHIVYDKNQIDLKCIQLAFETNKKLKMQCAALDFVYDEKGNPLIIEVSYGYNPKGYRKCEGWWDEELNWHDKSIQPEEWMIENLIECE